MEGPGAVSALAEGQAALLGGAGFFVLEESAEVEVLLLGSIGAQDPARRFIEENGYSKSSEYWLMSIDLEDEPAAPAWPAGIEHRTFLEEDAHAVKTLLDVSYAEEPHHIPLAFDDWRTFMLGDPSYDPGVWFVATSGDEFVGAALNWREGYVKDVVVHPDWRGRGLGKALMLQTFGEFARRGIRHVSLKTESTNPNRAWRFYEHLGMRKERTYELFEKKT